MHRLLYRHIMKMEARLLFFITMLCASVVYVFTFAECVKDISSITMCIWISFLKTPYMCFVLFPYFFFASVLATIWLLASSNQIIIMKTSRLSTANILTPMMVIASFAAMIWLFVLQPVSILANNKAISIEQRILNRSDNKQHLWFKHKGILFYANEMQGDTFSDVYTIENDNICYVPLANICKNSIILQSYNESDVLCTKDRVDFPNARKNINIHSQLLHHIIIKDLYVAAQEDLGPQYKKQLHILLSAALSFFTFTIISAIIALSVNRFTAKLSIGIQAICWGIIIQFANEVISSMLSCNETWMIYCIWLPNIIAMLIAIGYLIWKEE